MLHLFILRNNPILWKRCLQITCELFIVLSQHKYNGQCYNKSIYDFQQRPEYLFGTPERPDWFWSPVNLYLMGDARSFPEGKATGAWIKERKNSSLLVLYSSHV